MEFSQPSLELLANEEVYTLKVDARLRLSNGSAGQTFDPYLAKGPSFGDADTGITVQNDANLRATDFTPALPIGTILALPASLTLCSDTGATGAPETAIVTGLLCEFASWSGTPSSSVIRFVYSLDGINWVKLEATKPFSIRPMGCPVFQDGSVFEEIVLNNGSLNSMAAVTSVRNRRSLTSAPALKQLPSGKVISMIDSVRY